MEEGSLRYDANISVRLRRNKLGPRFEVKNLNSIRTWRRQLKWRSKGRLNAWNPGKPFSRKPEVLTPTMIRVSPFEQREMRMITGIFPNLT
jgi:Asp-tRNA(Asn)/Glu-tRNA(Gln) amidotransferase B subunit